MCHPAATLAVTAAATAASMAQQKQQADAQSAYQNNLMIQRNQQMEINRQIANQSAANEQAQINQQVSEKQIETSQTLQENSLEAARARAAAIVSSGEAGVSGLSVDSLLADFSRKEARFEDSVRQNQEGFEKNAEERKEAVEYKRRGRVASVQPYTPKPVSGPDYAGGLAKIAGAGINYYDQMQKRKGRTEP